MLTTIMIIVAVYLALRLLVDSVVRRGEQLMPYTPSMHWVLKNLYDNSDGQFVGMIHHDVEADRYYMTRSMANRVRARLKREGLWNE